MKTAKLIIVWLWVAIPLGWGVMKSLGKAMPLIAGGEAPASPGGNPGR